MDPQFTWGPLRTAAIKVVSGSAVSLRGDTISDVIFLSKIRQTSNRFGRHILKTIIKAKQEEIAN